MTQRAPVRRATYSHVLMTFSPTLPRAGALCSGLSTNIRDRPYRGLPSHFLPHPFTTTAAPRPAAHRGNVLAPWAPAVPPPPSPRPHVSDTALSPAACRSFPASSQSAGAAVAPGGLSPSRLLSFFAAAVGDITSSPDAVSGSSSSLTIRELTLPPPAMPLRDGRSRSPARPPPAPRTWTPLFPLLSEAGLPSSPLLTRLLDLTLDRTVLFCELTRAQGHLSPEPSGTQQRLGLTRPRAADSIKSHTSL